MNPSDRAPLIAILMLAARADGRTDTAEQAAIDTVVERIGAPDVSQLARQVSAGTLRVADLAGRLSDDEARRHAYASALAVCHADGATRDAERAFLDELKGALGLDAAVAEELDRNADRLSAAPSPGSDAAAATPAHWRLATTPSRTSSSTRRSSPARSRSSPTTLRTS